MADHLLAGPASAAPSGADAAGPREVPDWTGFYTASQSLVQASAAGIGVRETHELHGVGAEDVSMRPRQVAFVRNVMVGRRGLTRDALLEAFINAGGHNPVSHLSTGNVSFSASAGQSEAIGRLAEERIAQILGRREPVFVRALTALRRQMAGDPFGSAPWPDAYERCISFTNGRGLRELKLPIVSKRGDAALFDQVAADVYSVTRLVGGRPGKPGELLERALQALVTTRNWRTVERIIEAHLKR